MYGILLTKNILTYRVGLQTMKISNFTFCLLIVFFFKEQFHTYNTQLKISRQIY